ncbi:MAG: N-acetylneuraminate synthase family protein, partial [Fretibacterium sp.]|nr:N-acetylneuraminate synthase family protein [Fretibacterium sp.]
MSRPVVIAEVGCNHMGDMSIAHKMIQILGTMRLFSETSAIDVIKFQKRENRELLSPAEYAAPHPVPHNSYGRTYGEHREFLEFDEAQHRQLKEWCEEAGCDYSSSVWELTSAKKIASLSPKLIKVPSASNLNFEMLGYLAAEYGGEIHVSLGMTTHEEEERIVAFLDGKGRARDTVLYSCTSGYPVPFEDVCLREITRLREKFGSTVKAIGFSGHHLGIAVDVAALALGAEYFERHFTLDRTWKGTDHAASLEPDGMRKLARNLRSAAQALTYKPQEILEIEEVQRKQLKRAVTASQEEVARPPEEDAQVFSHVTAGNYFNAGDVALAECVRRAFGKSVKRWQIVPV